MSTVNAPVDDTPPPAYECIPCVFKSIKLSEYTRHVSTKKHQKRILAVSSDVMAYHHDDTDVAAAAANDSAELLACTASRRNSATTTAMFSYYCKICNRPYSARNSAWYHEKKCKVRALALSETNEIGSATGATVGNNDDNLAESSTTTSYSYHNKDELINKLLHDNAEMMKLIKEIVPRIGNTMITSTTHNKFNINVFLNEQCKDAINISDFVDSLKITMQDLHLTGERGLVESITNVLVQGLNDMDIYKRPIHCTDLKRDILYVKENEHWGRDEAQEHMRKSVNDIAYKQIISVQNWKNGLSDSDIHCDETLQLQYNTLLLKTLADTGEKDVRKIVRSVCKQVYLGPEMINNPASCCGGV